MEQLKIVIEMKGGVLQAVYSTCPLQYVIVDQDLIGSAGESLAVSSPNTEDVVDAHLSTLYDDQTPAGKVIKDALQKFGF
jgi:hypothetical protein